MPSKVCSDDAEIYRKVGKRVQNIRSAKNMTQETLAEKVGMSAKYIGFIEQGRKRPRIHILNRLAKALGTQLASFFISL